MNYKILVVNLKRRTDRKDNIIKLFNNINFEKYTFFEAIDGKNTDLNYEIKDLFENNDFNGKKGVIGCALSFYNIWTDLYEDKFNDYYVLFEDDIYLSNNFTEYFKKCKEYINNNIDNTDILFLGYTPYPKNILNNDSDFNIIDFNSDLYIGGFFGYMITKNGAIKMLDFINKNGIKHGIDYLIKINKDLKLKVIEPLITFSNPVRFYNDNIDTDIQKNNDVFNLNEIFDYNDYLFIKDYDQIGNDYIYNTYIKYNINDLIDISNKNDDIVAFNTLGFFKIKIDNLDNLNNSQYYYNNNGIFIKLNSIQKVKIIGNNLLNENFLWNNIRVILNNNSLSNNIINYHIINKNKNKNILNLEKTIFIEDDNYLWNNNYYNSWSKKCTKDIIKDNNNLLIIKGESLNINNNFLTYIKNKSIINIDLLNGNENKNKNNNYKYSLFPNNLSESILSETLTFYNKKITCIDSLAYIYIDTNNFEESFNIIENAIINDLWSQRINIIKKEKYKIMNYYSTIERIICKDLWKKNLNILNKSVLIYVLKDKSEFLINIFKEFNFTINIFENIDTKNIKIENINNSASEKKIIYTDNIKYSNIENNKIGDILNKIILFENILKDNNEYENYLIIDDDLELITSINNLFNHILYLPNNFDVCNINRSINKEYKIINQYNSLYYNVKKCKFKCKGSFFISKNGIKKILKYIKNFIRIESSFLIYDCYKNIENFNFYSIRNDKLIFDNLS